jgi:hypothetical protein
MMSTNLIFGSSGGSGQTRSICFLLALGAHAVSPASRTRPRHTAKKIFFMLFLHAPLTLKFFYYSEDIQKKASVRIAGTAGFDLFHCLPRIISRRLDPEVFLPALFAAFGSPLLLNTYTAAPARNGQQHNQGRFRRLSSDIQKTFYLGHVIIRMPDIAA